MIAAGSLKPGDRLRSVRELSAELAINPLTVARAYSELEREGLVEMRRGMGVFVANANTPAPLLTAKLAVVRAAAERFVLEAAQAGIATSDACRLVSEIWPHTPAAPIHKDHTED